MTSKDTQRPADAITDHWVDRLLPASARPYARLARLDRPIGTWLLFLPCLWGLLLANDQGTIFPPISHIALFGLGALVMRGAGCTFNDIIDRDIDARVIRTANRPLAAGHITQMQAIGFLIIQCLIGFVILIQFNTLTIQLGISSLILVAIYPFMKRITWWPQLFLGLAFNWGALMGYTSLNNHIDPSILWLYLAGIFWTLGYDTIYAHQDREDDALVGVKSSALRLGDHTHRALYVFYGAMIICLSISAWHAQLPSLFWFGLFIVAGHLWRQINLLDIHNPAMCLLLFRRNRDTGILVALSLLLAS